MWYRTLSLAVVCVLAAGSSAWAQPPGRGGRSNQEDALRKLEQEVAQLRAEVKKLQTAQPQPRQNWGGPQAFAGRPGFGPGGFSGPWQQMGFRGQQFGPRFGPQRGNPWQGSQGFHGGRYQSRGFDQRRPGDMRRFDQRGPGGRPGYNPQRRQPQRPEDIRSPVRGRRDDFFQGRPGRPGGPGGQNGPSFSPPRGRPGDERPNPERRSPPPRD